MNNYNSFFDHGKKTTQKQPEEIVNEVLERDPVAQSFEEDVEAGLSQLDEQDIDTYIENVQGELKQFSEGTETKEPNAYGTEIIVTCVLLNVRENASKESKVLTTAKKNESLMVLEVINEWTKIQTKSGVVGFVMSEFTKEA